MLFAVTIGSATVSARIGGTLNVNPDYLDERNIIVDAADRIIALQNANGAWDWIVTDKTGPTTNTYYNIEGVTAEVLLDAYKLTHDSKYLDAAKEAGDYIVATPISTTQRQNAFNIIFLYHLTEISSDGTYSTKASQIFSHITSEANYWSVNNGNHCADDAVVGCTAGELLDAYKAYRAGEGDPAGIVTWDLAPFVEAAQLSGDNTFAQNVADEIEDYLAQETYIETTPYYELGLSAGIKALSLRGMEYGPYVTKLLAKQGEDGHFASPNYPNEPIQSTAYALMSLNAVNDDQSIPAASYLSSQFGYGDTFNGWLDDGVEYSEVTSEAAQALFDYIYKEDTYYTIQDAINAAGSGDTINVAAGTYIESGQIVINKNLDIIGADKTTTIIKPAQNTGAGNHQDANAWILVNDGVTFNLQKVTLNGEGKLINHGILSHGHGIIDSNIFSNIGYNPSGPDYKGIAIELYNSDMTVSNNQFNNIGRIGVYTGFGSVATITGNTYTGKGDGNFLDYGFEVGRNGHATILDNTISDARGVASVDGSTSAGILVTSYFNPETPSSATITGNTITSSYDGIAVGYDGNDGSSVTANDNILTGNTFGIESTHPSVNAENNWWGTTGGPSGEGSGTGDAVSTNVDYFPWCTNEECTESTNDDLSTVVVDDDWAEYSNYQEVEVDGTKYYYNHNAFSTIQEGIEAVAAEGTIYVSAGTYSESVLIEKSLTLTSDSEVKPVITGGAKNNYIVKINADDVVLDNFEVNGGGSKTSDNAFDYGIWATGTDNVEIENSVIKNVWKNSGNGIQMDDSTSSNIHDNQISSFHKRGIRYVNSEGIFHDNEIIGDNVDGTSRVQNLVNLWTGSDVEIYDNVLHNALTTPGITPTWDSPSIFVTSYYASYPDSGSSHADIHDNEIYDGDSGIIVGSYYATTDTSSADIIDNNLHDLNWAINFEKGTVLATIISNKFSNVNKAVNADDSNGGPVTKPVIDAKNNYWGSASPDFGALLYEGVSYSPWYISDDMTDFSGVLNEEDKLSLPDAITLNLEDMTVEIPEGITITGEDGWTGVINAPTIKEIATVSPIDTGYTGEVDQVIEIGFPDVMLTFDKAVKIIIPNAAGKLVGYARTGETFHKITNVCAPGADQTWADNDANIPEAGECKIDVDSNSDGVNDDLVIWTKHFTQFVTYTQTQNPSAPSGGGSSGHSGSGSNCAYSCAAWGTCVNGKQTRTCTPNIYCDESDPNKALTERTCSIAEETTPLETKNVEETTPIESEQGSQPTQETVSQGGNSPTGRMITEISDGFGAHPLLSGLLITAILGGLGIFVYMKFRKQ